MGKIFLSLSSRSVHKILALGFEDNGKNLGVDFGVETYSSV